MNNEKGLTLIEVVVSLLILSIVLIAFITFFGDLTLLTSNSKEITVETFELQDVMENAIVQSKKEFTEGTTTPDYTMEIFTGESDYESDVEVIEIEEIHSSNRKYVTLVSNVEIMKPAVPVINNFDVGAFLASDTNYTTHVFPWYEDNIVLGGKYELGDDPTIFENRIRWYRSQVDIDNPVFTSEYDVVDEELIEEPDTEIMEYREITKADELLNNRFYYFQLRPYTLAGRVNFEKNDKRIVTLSKPDSTDWQQFIEGIYPKTSAGDTKIFDFGSDVDIYSEVMQNPNRATFNTDWSNNSDPEGALVGTQLPSQYLNSSFATEIKFQVDNQTRTNNDLTLLGHGFYLGDTNNTGVMMTFDVVNDELNLNTVANGAYAASLMSIDLTTASEFNNLLVEVEGEELFDWSQEYTVEILYDNDTSDIEFTLSYTDSEDNEYISDPVSINTSLSSPTHFGFKAYSNLEYVIDPLGIVVNKYARNFSTHFYDLDFKTSGEMEIVDGYFEDEDTVIIEFFETISDDVTIEEDVNGNGTIEDDERYIYFADDDITIDSVTRTGTNNNQIAIELDEDVSIYEMVLGKDIFIKTGSVEILNEGVVQITNGDPYNVKIPTKIIFNEDFEAYDVTTFNNNYNSTGNANGWFEYEYGDISLVEDSDNKYLKKINNNDPNGAYKALDESIDGDQFYIVELKINRLNNAGGDLDRFSISHQYFNDDIYGYGVRIGSGNFSIERRYSEGNADLLESNNSFTRSDNVWYRVIFVHEPGLSNNLIAMIYNQSGDLISEVETYDDSYIIYNNIYDHFYIHGGHEFGVDDITIRVLE